MATQQTIDRVLVTGAGGFIGSHLTAALAARGKKIRALDLHPARILHLRSAGSVEVLTGDIGDAELVSRALEGVETVYHLAAAHLGVLAPEREYRRINVDAVESLVRQAREAGVRRFVHCSTIGVHGRIERPPANEDSPCRPELVYERTKLAGEKVVREAIRRDGFPAVVLRPVWVYGPGCARTEKLFRAAARGRLVMSGARGSLRHCVYVKDMIAALQLAATTSAALGRVFVVGDGAAVAVRSLLHEVTRIVDGRPPRRLPLWLLWSVAAAIETGFRVARREPPISRRSLRFFTANTAFDTARARDGLGFRPGYDLSHGLRETYRLLSERRPWRVEPTDYPTTEEAARHKETGLPE